MSVDQSIDQTAALSEVVYKQLPHLPGYRIGSDGTVWSERARIRIHTGRWKRLIGGVLPKRGHCYVNLVFNGKSRPFFVHRLVLEAFVGPCPPGMEACHFPDRNPANCRLDNLRWDTHAENMRDAVKHGSMQKGSKRPTAKLTEADIPVIHALRARGWVILRIAKVFEVSFEAVRRIVCGKAWTHVTEGEPV